MLRGLLHKLRKSIDGSGISVPLVAVQSKSLACIGYDAQTRILGVEYYNGLIYEIRDFPEKQYRKLMESDDLDRDFLRTVVAEYRIRKVGRTIPFGR